MFAFYFLIFLAIVVFIFLACSIYRPLGIFFSRIITDVINTVNEEDEYDDDNEIKNKENKNEKDEKW